MLKLVGVRTRYMAPSMAGCRRDNRADNWLGWVGLLRDMQLVLRRAIIAHRLLWLEGGGTWHEKGQFMRWNS